MTSSTHSCCSFLFTSANGTSNSRQNWVCCHVLKRCSPGGVHWERVGKYVGGWQNRRPSFKWRRCRRGGAYSALCGQNRRRTNGQLDGRESSLVRTCTIR